jgi:type II secretory pathway component PulC
MRDNLICLVTFISIFFLYIYADVIVDITPQLITLNQRSKSDKYHKNKHSSIQIFIKKNSFIVVPMNRSPIPEGHFRHMILKCEIHIYL